MTNIAGAGSAPHEVDGQSVATDVRDGDKPAKFVPGQPDMWAFVLFEALLFTAYWAVYLFFRAQDTEAYLQSQADLDLRIGVFNTIVLLLSSWSVARCVQTSRAGAFRAALANAFLTMFFGFVFLVSKVFEWVHQIQAGNTITASEFFQHYFFLTSIHSLHLLIGFVVLGVVVYQLWSPARRSQKLVETGATYWHTVDFLWVLIFALLYVMR
jgi:nitric oxide reductase NorE protein